MSYIHGLHICAVVSWLSPSLDHTALNSFTRPVIRSACINVYPSNLSRYRSPPQASSRNGSQHIIGALPKALSDATCRNVVESLSFAQISF